MEFKNLNSNTAQKTGQNKANDSINTPSNPVITYNSQKQLVPLLNSGTKDEKEGRNV